jgi:hypothetical protein
MALIDLKSDLSKFRKPIDKPLVDKPRVDVNTKINTTPLESLANGVSSPNRPVQPELIGGVTPKPVDQSEKFKGETTPTVYNNSEKFKGQTDPTLYNNTEKFKGETTPTIYDNTEEFKGQSDPKLYDNTEKFKGENEPKIFKFVKQFLGEVSPKPFTFVQQFLGETTTNSVSQGDKFKGEVTPIPTNQDEQFKGETTPNLVVQGDKFKGETTIWNTNIGVDFFKNDKAIGFSQKVDTKSKFTGVDPSQTIFKNNSLYGLFKSTNYGVTKDLDNGLGKSYTDSKLKGLYNKYNLKEDSYNNWFIKHPLILTGIQTKKGEPFNYGIGGLSFIRGGAVTAVTRAAIDVVRIGQMLLTPRGIIWSLKQVGMQRSQRYGKTWTPINLLANIGTQHLGLKFPRAGVLPVDDTFRYTNLFTNGPELVGVYRKVLLGSPLLKTDLRGGFDSFYGIGVTNTTRTINTFKNAGKLYGDFIAGGGVSPMSSFKQKFNPLDAPVNADGLTYKTTIPVTDAEKKQFGVASRIVESTPTKYSDNFESKLISQTEENSPIPIDDANDGKPTPGVAPSSLERKKNLLKSDGFIAGSPDIADYEMLSYGTIKKFASGKDADGNTISAFNDFRLASKNTNTKNRASSENFKNRNLKKRVGWDGKAGFFNFPEENDLIKFIIGSTQFRATLNGITDNWSPSWNNVKYPGNPYPVYMYESFERTVSFNFKVYAMAEPELKTVYEKLQALSNYTLPNIGGQYYTGQLIKIKIGSIIDKNGFITSLTYTVPDEISWDIAHEKPIGIDVSVGATLAMY